MHCGLRRFQALQHLGDFDLVLIHREAFPFFAPLVESYVLRRHPKVIFSFDDAIYVGHDNCSGLSHPFLYRVKHGKGYDEVIRQSSHVVVGNAVLAAHARQFNSLVTIVPTVVDTEKVWPKPALPASSMPITIGWVGSASTASYLSMIEPPLQQIARAYPERVRFRFFGYPDYKPQLPKSVSLPFNLRTEGEDIRSLDIGLMPMPDTEWTRGKCAFKAIQYMACGVATVASPVGVTTDLIQHEVNGLLAKSSDEWLGAIKRLICDVDLRRRLAERARDTIVKQYSLQVWGPRLVECFDQVLSRTQVEPVAIAA